MSVLDVSEGTDPIIQSNILKTQIEFSLFDLCQILDLPNTIDHCYLIAFDDLLAYGRTESEVYSTILSR